MTDQPAKTRRSAHYERLTERLASAGADSVTLPVDEIDDLVGGLPASAHKQASWWANNASHVQARAWMGPGFRVAAVDPGGAVRFVRVSGRIATLEIMERMGMQSRVVGRLDRRSGQVLADPGGAALLADDFVAVLPRGPRKGGRVRPRAGEAYLLACWFTLRGTQRWGRLLDWDGNALSRDEGLALMAAYRDAGAWDEDGTPR